MNDSLQSDSFHGDPYDLIELQQLLAGPHKIIVEGTSPFQEVLLIEKKNIRLYVNQKLDFNSLDEKIYHEALVHPAMIRSVNRARVLLIGGENGLALREILKYPDVEMVTLLPFSQGILEVIQNTPEMSDLHEGSLFDRRVHIEKMSIDHFLNKEQQFFDVIILDLPEPSSEAVSRYYTKELFQHLNNCLTAEGILVCQSNSPEYTPFVFWSIGKTIEDSYFHTLSYHVNVPWFGDWGFHLARKKMLVWNESYKVTVPHCSLPVDLSSLFRFPIETQSYKEQAIVNTLDCLFLHKFFAASEVETIPEEGLSVFYKVQQMKEEHVVDNRELNELNKLLSGPHRILYENNHLILVETTDIRLYLDKQLQFSSLDEKMYHEALVHPAMTIVKKRDNILIVGGGDGFAIRELLKYPEVKQIDLVDLDPLVIYLATSVPEVVSLNNGAMHDNRVSVHQQDIRIYIQKQSKLYDVIIVDLPDPSNKEISRLYTVEFFNQLSALLSENGILVCQSHSPEYAPLLFWSIGLTIQKSGFYIYSYYTDVPSFGEWGFHLAGKKPILWDKHKITIPHETLPEDLSSLFAFPLEIRSIIDHSQINSLNNLILHELYTFNDH